MITSDSLGVGVFLFSTNFDIIAYNLNALCDVAENGRLTEYNIFGKQDIFKTRKYLDVDFEKQRDLITPKKKHWLSCLTCPLKPGREVLESADESDFRDVIRDTERLFRECVQDIANDVREFETQLMSCCRADQNISYCSPEVRKSLQSWYRVTKRFFFCLKTPRSDKLRRTVFGYLCQPEKSFLPSAEAYSENFLKPAQCRHIIVLENKTGQPLPYKSLTKIILNRSLENSEERALNKWIGLINDKQIKVKLLHRTITAITKHVSTYHKTDADNNLLDVASVEDALYSKGCDTIFLQNDEKYIEKRELLLYGSKIHFGNQQLTINGSINPKEPYMEDQTRVFDIQEYPDHVLLVGFNEAMGLKEIWAEKYGYGIITRECIEKHDGLAIVEKLSDPLRHHKWVSQPGKEVVDHDLDVLKPIVNMLLWLAPQERPTPNNLSVNHLLFDREKVLKSTKVLTAGPHNFDALERFAFECSLNNKRIFHYLMTNSGLGKDSVARFYQSTVRSATKNKTLDIRLTALSFNVDDKAVMNRAEGLYHKISTMAGNLKRRMENLWWTKPPNWQEKEISKAILHYYESIGSAGLLWETMEEDIYAELSLPRPVLMLEPVAPKKIAPSIPPSKPEGVDFPMTRANSLYSYKIEMLEPEQSSLPNYRLFKNGSSRDSLANDKIRSAVQAQNTINICRKVY
jgi:hypothetical protein